jgi:PAS domain S-box-containing protein
MTRKPTYEDLEERIKALEEESIKGKRAQEVLRESEAVLKSLLAATPAGVGLLKGRTFIQVNTALCRITGYSEEEMVGMQTRILYPDEEEFLRIGRELYEQMEREGLGMKEATLRHKEGARIDVILHLSPFDPEDLSAGVCATVLDITERKQAEKALAMERRFFEALFEALPGHAYVLDENGRYIRCNHNLEQSFGKALIGKSLFDDLGHIHPGYRERVRGALQQGLMNDHASVEYISLLDDGTEVPRFATAQTFELDGKRYGVGVSFDISDRVKAEEEQRRLSIAIEQAAEDIIITDREGIIQYVNPAFEKITGYSRREAIGRTPRFLKSGVHEPAFYEHLWKTIKGGEVWNGRITNRRRDGKLIQEDATISPLLTSMGKLTGYVALKRDVTEAIRLETHFRQAQKMEAIGTLAGGIAHDFNNILGAMMGYTELVKFKTTDTEIYPYLEQILIACARSRDLVHQILTFSRQREQEKKPMAVTPIVKEALKLLRSSLPATIEIRQLYHAQYDTVCADPTQIHQILMNLCTNAVHAMREREGVLEVRLGQQVLSAYHPAYHPELKEGAYLQIVVSDTGEGIDPAIKDKIFDPFFTTKKSGEGTGLGLSVVYGIVKDHGGIISVESEIGKGTAFTICLPLIVADEEREGQETAPIPKGEGCILYVDDEEPIAALGQEMLNSLGYDVTVRFSSHDAFEVFHAHPERFSLVITDMTMPNMTGASLAREMLKIRPGLPIILTTGFSERINEEEAKRIGIREFLMKPVSLSCLAQAVKRVMDQEAPPAGC